MSYSLYDATVPLAKNALKSLTRILQTGEAAPNSASFLAARLAPDMLPLAFQVRMVTDLSTKIVGRLHGVEPYSWEGDITTYADCYTRISKAEEILATADKDLINQRQNEVITLGMGPNGTFQMPGANYINGYVLPNLFFHLTAAYSILRKEGVPLGKDHFLTSFVGEFLTTKV